MQLLFLQFSAEWHFFFFESDISYLRLQSGGLLYLLPRKSLRSVFRSKSWRPLVGKTWLFEVVSEAILEHLAGPLMVRTSSIDSYLRPLLKPEEALNVEDFL